MPPRGPFDGATATTHSREFVIHAAVPRQLATAATARTHRALLVCQGKLPLPKLAGHRSPEDEASRFLPNASHAETSALMSSWSGPAFSTDPGTEPLPSKSRKNRSI